jgi:hypothetical protein
MLCGVALLPVLFAFELAAQQRVPKTPDIHFVPTPQHIADAMLKLARVTPDDVVYDLGSGDGRIVILAAQKYGARGVGIELDPGLVEISVRSPVRARSPAGSPSSRAISSRRTFRRPRSWPSGCRAA